MADLDFEDASIFPTAWTVANIGGLETPGLVAISGAERKYDWDKKKGKGTAGAHNTFQGDDPQSFECKITIWDGFVFYGTEKSFTEQLSQLKKIRTLLLARPAKSVQAIGIIHPTTISVEIVTIIVDSVGQFTHEGKGKFSQAFKFHEYKFPKPTPATTPTSTKNANQPPGAAQANSKNKNDDEITKAYNEFLAAPDHI